MIFNLNGHFNLTSYTHRFIVHDMRSQDQLDTPLQRAQQAVSGPYVHRDNFLEISYRNILHRSPFGAQ
jgi:hypothetical protein